MNELELKFKSIVGGSNIFTPKVIGYYERGSYIIELSMSNSLFCGEWAFGVTVANHETKEHCHLLCKSFLNKFKDIGRKKAMEYINSLA